MSISGNSLPAWRMVSGAMRKFAAVALLAGASVASAGYVTSFDQAVLDDIFSQTSFGGYDIDIRFNAPLSVVAPVVADLSSTEEFNGNNDFSLSWLAGELQVPNFTVALFFVDTISFCGGPGSNIIGCGSRPGGLIALQSAAAAGNNGTVLFAHELGHNLGSAHTHCYSPPVDQCYRAESGCYSGSVSCPGAGPGTLMSYCNFGAPNGANCGSNQLVFHPTVITRIGQSIAANTPACIVPLGGGGNEIFANGFE